MTNAQSQASEVKKPQGQEGEVWCRKNDVGPRIRITTGANFKRFCKRLLKNEYSVEVLKYVKTFSLAVPYTLSPQTIQPDFNNVETWVTSVDTDTLMAWFLLVVVTKQMTALTLIEILALPSPTDCPGIPIVPALLSHFPHVTSHISFANGLVDTSKTKNAVPMAALPSRTLDRIKILKVHSKSSADLHDVQTMCGPCLPKAIERFDLVVDNSSNAVIEASTLHRLFSRCENLQSLSIKWGRISNPDGIQWVPDTVTHLQVYQYHHIRALDDVKSVPIRLNNVTAFKVYSPHGNVFTSFYLPNLQRLAIHGPVDNEVPLVAAVSQTLSQSPQLAQLKCRMLKVRSVARILRSCPHENLRSLIIQPGSSTFSAATAFADYCALARACGSAPNLQYVLVNIPMCVNRQKTEEFMALLLEHAPRLTHLYVEHLTLVSPFNPEATDNTWLEKLPPAVTYVNDTHSPIRLDPRHCTYVINLEKLRQRIQKQHSASAACPTTAPATTVGVVV
ncbi:hypothetical protein TRVA0_017S00562 [Trichomonascus vanleenenianus]|uniref:uncharacterized protein n=1 Tax=Trichomonascus vanleenenianus TaxID=2268995 RepID=UPI003ECAA845